MHGRLFRGRPVRERLRKRRMVMWAWVVIQMALPAALANAAAGDSPTAELLRDVERSEVRELLGRRG